MRSKPDESLITAYAPASVTALIAVALDDGAKLLFHRCSRLLYAMLVFDLPPPTRLRLVLSVHIQGYSQPQRGVFALRRQCDLAAYDAMRDLVNTACVTVAIKYSSQLVH